MTRVMISLYLNVSTDTLWTNRSSKDLLCLDHLKVKDGWSQLAFVNQIQIQNRDNEELNQQRFVYIRFDRLDMFSGAFAHDHQV